MVNYLCHQKLDEILTIVCSLLLTINTYLFFQILLKIGMGLTLMAKILCVQ